MRLVMLALALVLLPAASAASIPLPVAHVAEVDTPTDGCGDCVNVTAGAGVGIPDCYDCPGWGALLEVEHGDGAAEARVRVCYTGFYYECYVDETVQA